MEGWKAAWLDLIRSVRVLSTQCWALTWHIWIIDNQLICFIIKFWLRALFCLVHFDVVKLWKYYDIAPISILVLSAVQSWLYSRLPSLLSCCTSTFTTVLSPHSEISRQTQPQRRRLAWQVSDTSGDQKWNIVFIPRVPLHCTAPVSVQSPVQRMRLDHRTTGPVSSWQLADLNIIINPSEPSLCCWRPAGQKTKLRKEYHLDTWCQCQCQSQCKLHQ